METKCPLIEPNVKWKCKAKKLEEKVSVNGFEWGNLIEPVLNGNDKAILMI